DQEQDDGTGLYNYDARLYDPVLGQFVMADTLVPDQFNPQSLNRYVYCYNNPMSYVDPNGHVVLGLSKALGSTLLSAFGYQHSAISINGQITGYHSQAKGGIKDETDEWDDEDEVTVVVIDVTDKSDGKYQDIMDDPEMDTKYNDDNYNPISKNCNNFVQDVMTQAGDEDKAKQFDPLEGATKNDFGKSTFGSGYNGRDGYGDKSRGYR
ncbi:MAG: RHS repeat-associated core domain-containing protein, partial [Proteobacteria bacterium]|nr:RHS repeat-associated core domain-containing protein [Pseudomonadota bacterium]MBU1584839.1 RHS repeat-associated core domain-containing protein [Pseudomonadota bacterium]